MERVSSLFEYCNSDCPSASELNLLTTLSWFKCLFKLSGMTGLQLEGSIILLWVFTLTAEVVLSVRPGTSRSSSRYSVVNCLGAFMQTHDVRPKTPWDLLEFFQSTFTFINEFWKNDWYFLIIYSSIHFIHSQPKKKIFWVSNSRLTQSLVNIYHISFQRTFCVKLREQACMSGNGKFWSVIKQSVKQLLSRTKIFNDHLWKFGTKNSVFKSVYSEWK